jgi:hypothetical protein
VRKKSGKNGEKAGGKYLPFISGAGSRLPVMQLPVTIPHKYDLDGAYILLSSL